MLEILDKSITQSEFLGSATHHPPPTARAIRAHDTACQTNLISASGEKNRHTGWRQWFGVSHGERLRQKQSSRQHFVLHIPIGWPWWENQAFTVAT